MNENYQLYHGDCLEIMQQLIEDGFKVDLILTDPPYGTTKCKWDTPLPLVELWEELNNIIHDTTPILLFGTQPFLSQLINTNLKNFRYNLIWDKHCISHPFSAKYQPLRVHEEIAVFYKKKPFYNPIKVPQRHGGDRTRISEADKKVKHTKDNIRNTPIKTRNYYIDDGLRYPQTIISQFSSQMEECVNNLRVHPTQKPVKLLEYLIKTYTNENDVVLDFTMGSGSTGVACMNLNRKFIGIELEEKYYNIAEQRLKEATQSKQTTLI